MISKILQCNSYLLIYNDQVSGENDILWCIGQIYSIVMSLN